MGLRAAGLSNLVKWEKGSQVNPGMEKVGSCYSSLSLG